MRCCRNLVNTENDFILSWWWWWWFIRMLLILWGGGGLVKLSFAEHKGPFRLHWTKSECFYYCRYCGRRRFKCIFREFFVCLFNYLCSWFSRINISRRRDFFYSETYELLILWHESLVLRFPGIEIARDRKHLRGCTTTFDRSIDR